MSPATRRVPRRLAAMGCGALLATALTGCGSVKSITGGGDSAPITLGTTNSTSVLDPAGAYDLGSWMILENSFQTLLRYPAGATVPQPDAAQECGFTGADAMTYQCTLRTGLSFSNGHPLTAQDVAFSIDRMKKIADPNGPSDLFSTVKSVEATSATQVVFHLSQADAVLPDKLASAAGSIVDHQVFPADKELPNDQLVGSGPYAIDSVDESGSGAAKSIDKVTLSANGKYKGDQELHNKKFAVRFFTSPDDLKSALDSGAVDLTDNSLDPAVSARMLSEQNKGQDGVKVTTSDSSDTRFMVFNTKDATMGQVAVRQAIAQVLDRQTITRDVYQRTAQPLYSVVPAGVTGHNTAFYDHYGDPDPAKAKAILAAAKITTPVKFTLTWSRTRAKNAEADAIKRQLEATGLFQVTVTEQPDWEAFKKGWADGSYQAYTVGWSADYPDADDFVVPLVVDGGAFHNGFDDPQISQQLVPQTLKQADRGAATTTFGAIQNAIATQVPLLPLFQNTAFYAAKPNITGVDATVDSTGIFRFGAIGRS
ncbi:ABC transporter substrate-binding protein [Kitasatospora viridis]|uniref:Peptide/nickel transport system substrate-binding protein n=1 Tax=Kitasatospora viridis TaxID=281105 RepID=A0A561UNH5_9ACTN|nr:ABC transporter substrate-binding protein [Kitasatospora viridis]TWG00919.1 peptide/nickel transport system substrate-binding protein [Kitasatospora viridis]